jgi:hypothetical protein
MLISAFTRTQIAALFGTAILTVLPATQFSGMMTPVSSLTGSRQIMGRGFPMTYFVPISVGTFTKGLGFHDLARDLRSWRLRPGADPAERAAAAQAGTLRGRPMRSAANIFWLGTKELRSFLHDYVLIGLVIYAFSFAVITCRRGAIRRSCTTPRSRSSTRIIPSSRAASCPCLPAAAVPAAAADRERRHRSLDERRENTPS